MAYRRKRCKKFTNARHFSQIGKRYDNARRSRKIGVRYENGHKRHERRIKFGHMSRNNINSVGYDNLATKEMKFGVNEEVIKTAPKEPTTKEEEEEEEDLKLMKILFPSKR